jgi:Tfp pilus assembly protein PilV
MFTVSGGKLLLAQQIPATQAASHQVTIQVADSHGLTRQRLFNIAVVTATPIQANYVADQSLNSTFWTTTGLTVPDADTVMETDATSTHQIANAATMPRNAGILTYNTWVDATASLGRTEAYVQVFDANWDSQAYAYYNLATGTVDWASTTGTFTNNVPFISALPNGQFRCGFKFTTDASSTGFHLVAGTALTDGGNSFLGVDTDGLKIENPWLYNLSAGAGGY